MTGEEEVGKALSLTRMEAWRLIKCLCSGTRHAPPESGGGGGGTEREGVPVMVLSPWFMEEIQRGMLSVGAEMSVDGDLPWPSAGLVALAWARLKVSKVPL